MNLYNVLLFVHVLAAMAWLGGGLVLLLMAARLRQSPDETATFARLLPFIGIRLLMPAVVLLPVTGIWMVLDDSDWSFRQAWVRIALGLFVIAFAVGAVYLSRVGIRMARAAGGAPTELLALVSRWMAGYAIVLVVLLLVVADMVFKPGAS
jgi:uncharacterized membrane protein